jgi:hypothetical protein
MPPRKPEHRRPTIPTEQIEPEPEFIDTATRRRGVVRQRRADALYVFHPQDDSDPVPIEEPGRFFAAASLPTWAKTL